MSFDTQLIRNAYLQRDVGNIDMPFGKFAAYYLGVKDSVLEHEANVSVACNIILNKRYNEDHGTPPDNSDSA